MRILCCGDRNWNDAAFIHRVLSKLSKDTIIIHGACRGADNISSGVALKLRIEQLSFPAKWSTYGRAAGPIRNQQMLDEGLPDKVYAFHDNISSSKGTRDMMDKAEACNIPVILFTHKDE